ncbi:zinc finger HIT domain-containing protein 1-like [Varroa jacobsoni]|uniref:HIT-type domain-containing protein n=1 Tax=Varroa destructor TaxID=109461 RepID=A0A7M7M9J7_VARDE|nr:zinc finger HIT domain-containing protein 1-like [Varroa destructor]XP_022708237.1 zinc finger HIT domain-containing protein 1-like [Varroa jacobsoni]
MESTGSGKRRGDRIVLDEAQRERRRRKALDALEQDNYHEDPHANLVMNKKAPKFEETLLGPAERKERPGKRKGVRDFKQVRYKKSLDALLEEDHALGTEPPNYMTAQAAPSKFPARQFCSVCGFEGPYRCVTCGSRYCSVKCLNTHQDVRCLKWMS